MAIDRIPTDMIEDRVTKQKLSEQLAQKAKQADLDKYEHQEDFVETLRRNSNINKLFTVSCTNITKHDYSIVYDIGNNRGVEYLTDKQTVDDYIILKDGRVGATGLTYSNSDNPNYDSNTGTWVTSSPPNYYTTQVGATFTKTLNTAGFDFNFFGDNRGGIWEFVVDGDTANKITISTWRSTGQNVSLQIVRFLDNKIRTIVATFKGDDPLNVPSGGAGTSRGWVVYDTVSTTRRTFVNYLATKSVTPDTTPLYGQSNKEFAINMHKAGTSNPDHFTPYHDTTTSYNVVPPTIMVDGVPTTFTTGQMISGVSEFKILQQIYGRNPETPDNLVKVTTVTTFKDGRLFVEGKVEFLNDVVIQSGFGIMFPVSNPFCDKIKTSIGNSYDTNLSDGSLTFLTDEKDKNISFLALSSTYKNVGLACTYNNPKKTLRWGGAGKAIDTQRTWIENRNVDLIKLYQQMWNNATVTTGSVFRFSGTFMIAEFTNLYDLF
jgi:hypothetical protein